MAKAMSLIESFMFSPVWGRSPGWLSCFSSVCFCVDFKLFAGNTFDAAICKSFHFEVFPIGTHWCAQNVAATSGAAGKATAWFVEVHLMCHVELLLLIALFWCCPQKTMIGKTLTSQTKNPNGFIYSTLTRCHPYQRHNALSTIAKHQALKARSIV